MVPPHLLTGGGIAVAAACLPGWWDREAALFFQDVQALGSPLSRIWPLFPPRLLRCHPGDQGPGMCTPPGAGVRQENLGPLGSPMGTALGAPPPPRVQCPLFLASQEAQVWLETWVPVGSTLQGRSGIPIASSLLLPPAEWTRTPRGPAGWSWALLREQGLAEAKHHSGTSQLGRGCHWVLSGRQTQICLPCP